MMVNKLMNYCMIWKKIKVIQVLSSICLFFMPLSVKPVPAVEIITKNHTEVQSCRDYYGGPGVP